MALPAQVAPAVGDQIHPRNLVVAQIKVDALNRLRNLGALGVALAAESPFVGLLCLMRPRKVSVLRRHLVAHLAGEGCMVRNDLRPGDGGVAGLAAARTLRRGRGVRMARLSTDVYAMSNS